MFVSLDCMHYHWKIVFLFSRDPSLINMGINFGGNSGSEVVDLAHLFQLVRRQ